jgi:hypothetical protein
MKNHPSRPSSTSAPAASSSPDAPVPAKRERTAKSPEQKQLDRRRALIKSAGLDRLVDYVMSKAQTPEDYAALYVELKVL